MVTLNFNRILIVRLSALGDVINTLPALAILRKNYPKSFIAWVVEDKAKDILLGHPGIDKVFIFRRKDWQINLTSPKKLLRMPKEVPDFIRQMKDNKFDIALDFQGNLKSGVISYFSGARDRVGFEKSTTREFNHLFLNHKVPVPQPRINRVAKNILLLKSLGLDTENYKVKLSDNPADEDYFAGFSKEHLTPNRPLVVFHPGTSKFGLYKRWQPANYATLGDKLIKEYQADLVFTYGPGERGLIEEITSQMKQGALINYQTNPFTRFIPLFKKASLFVGSDSGPLHLANLIGTPVIALFGPKDPVVNGPYHNKNAIIIRKNLECSPCTKRTCPKPDCMNLITVNEVFETIKKVLAKNL
jgi:lipopolysaccharide heptosyltransferase II